MISLSMIVHYVAVLGNVNIADNDAVLQYTIVVDGK